MPLPPPPKLESYVQLRATDRADLGTFGSVRRLRVNLGGGDARAAWLIQLFAKGGNRSITDEKLYLHDAWVRKALPGGATLQIGQTRPPFSRERQTGDRQLLLPDRPSVVDAIMPGGGLSASFARDLGVTWSHGALSAGVYGGNGALQQRVHGSGPLFAVRQASLSPHGLSVGFSAAYRRDRNFDASRAFPGTKTSGFDRFNGDDARLGIEAQWRRGRWQAVGEWLQADLRGSGRLRASGGYGLLSESFAPGWQALARLETFDSNRAVKDRNDTRTAVFGINCTPKRHPRERWQLAYTLRRESVGEVHNDGVTLQWQHWLGGR